jgi:class 3 adenylate cyclase/CHASE2 domain-containing sensor protein
MRGKHRTTRAIFLICIVMAAVASVVSISGWLEVYELKMVNAAFRSRYWIRSTLGTVRVSDRVVLAGIDAKSVDPALSDYSDRWGTGAWHTRDNWVRAIEYLAYYKPKVFAIDVFFSPKRSSARTAVDLRQDSIETVEKMIRENKMGLRDLAKGEKFPRLDILDILDDSGSNTLAARLFDLDDVRSRGEKMPDFVIPYYFTESGVNASSPWDAGKDAEKINRLRRQSIPPRFVSGIPPHYPYADNATLPFDSLLEAPATLGFIDVPRDPEDGNIRRIPLVHGFRDPNACRAPVFMASLALASCLLDMGISLEQLAGEKSENPAVGIRVEFGKEIRLWNKTRELRIPIDRDGRMFLNFEGKIRDFPQISFVDLIKDGKAKQVRDLLEDRIVIAGVTFTGGTDVGPCAIDSNVPLAFIHMTAIDNILRQSFLRPAGKAIRAGALFLLLLCVGWASSGSRVEGSGVGTLLLLLGYLGAAFLLFYFDLISLPVVVPALAVIVTFAAVSLYRYQVEQKARIDIRKKFSTMVSGDVLERMEENPESLALGGERRDVTVFFSDVAGFTRVAEGLSPTKLVEVINTYLTPMTEIILESRGYLNKFLGDGIMAVWGAPLPLEDHAALACRSALAQQRKIDELRPIFAEKFEVDLQVRMGINTGAVDAGNMGSLNRFEYTVMGDAVNLAARLEPANKDYGSKILIAQPTWERIRGKGLVTRLLDRIVVQGKTEPVEIYELCGLDADFPPDKKRAIDLFEEGLRLYWDRKWEQAFAKFEGALKLDPDNEAARLFIERTKACQSSPPPDGWKGEHIREKKG